MPMNIVSSNILKKDNKLCERLENFAKFTNKLKNQEVLNLFNYSSFKKVLKDFYFFQNYSLIYLLWMKLRSLCWMPWGQLFF
jgi:hypothetical protein